MHKPLPGRVVCLGFHQGVRAKVLCGGPVAGRAFLLVVLSPLDFTLMWVLALVAGAMGQGVHFPVLDFWVVLQLIVEGL